jgi:hypothetical protein
MRTLENSYCRPKNEAEWKLIGLYNPIQPFCVEHIKGRKRYSSRPKKTKTEIPIQQFIDLLEDRMATWRLIEAGFENKVLDYYDISIQKSERKWHISVRNNEVTLNGELINIANHTDLLTLIRFLK